MRGGIDGDLETICLKCLDNEPSHRYGSAAAVADDLRRWLQGRPIAARPISNIARLWRWCRRNPTWATGSLLALGLLLFFSWRLWQENHTTRLALQRENQAVMEARQARDLAQDHLARSLYEQARALGSLATTGSRWQVLDLIPAAEQLRRRQRETSQPPWAGDELTRLPSQAELRSEAAMALLRHDLRLRERSP